MIDDVAGTIAAARWPVREIRAAFALASTSRWRWQLRNASYAEVGDDVKTVARRARSCSVPAMGAPMYAEGQTRMLHNLGMTEDCGRLIRATMEVVEIGELTMGPI
jgi:hypothetical protein